MRAPRIPLALATLLALATQARAEQITGLVHGPGIANGLVFFDSASPGTVTAPVAITGLQANELLIGIDYRPTTNILYGVGDSNRVYTINPTTGAVINSAVLTSAPGQSFAGLSGTFFGIDFNPVPDLAGMPSLRVVSNTDQNLRINVNPPSVGQVNVDTSITPTGLSIVGSAYSNNDTDPATGTTLFGISSSTNALVRATNANLGTYVTVDPLGVDPSSFVGFDISGVTAVGYAGMILDGSAASTLYTINYTAPDGTNPNRATLVGTIGLQNGFNLRGLAVAVPEPASVAMMGLGAVAVIGLAARRRGRSAGA